MTPAAAELLYPLAALMAEEPFKLVIMDSVSANMRVDYTGRGALVLPALAMHMHCLSVSHALCMQVSCLSGSKSWAS